MTFLRLAVSLAGLLVPLLSLTILRRVYEHSSLKEAGSWPRERDWSWAAPREEATLRPRVPRESLALGRRESVVKAAAFVLESRGELSEGALSLLESVARADPPLFERLISLPLLESDLQSMPLAAGQDLRKGWPDVLVHAAETLRRVKRYRKALEFLEEALRQEPRSERARLRRAAVLAAMGRVREARRELDGIPVDAEGLPELGFWRLHIY